jgi:hypothetical protein
MSEKTRVSVSVCVMSGMQQIILMIGPPAGKR